MAVAANTIETYDNEVIREDLEQAFSMISPEETPFHQMAGRKPATQPKFEWSVVDLADVVYDNRVIEGEDAPATDAGTLADRRGNYCQISDKVVSVSHTSDATDAAAENIQDLAEQVALKIRELKRDCEAMVLDNVGASAGASGTARASAGLMNFLTSNVHLETGNVVATQTNGVPTGTVTGATTPVPVDEDAFNALLQTCWEAGADTQFAMVNANNKRVISSTFTGSSTRYKDAIDKQLVNAVDIYTSDFNELQIVPNRFQAAVNRSTDNDEFAIYLIDPAFVKIVELEGTKQKPLAETGHSRKRLVWREWGLQVDNEEALGMYLGTSGAAV